MPFLLRKRLKDRHEVSERKQVGDAEAVVNAPERAVYKDEQVV